MWNILDYILCFHSARCTGKLSRSSAVSVQPYRNCTPERKISLVMIDTLTRASFIIEEGDQQGSAPRRGGIIRGVANMEYEIDISRLRMDMMDYYGTALASGFPMVVIDLSNIENAAADELIDLAQKNGWDVRKYIIR